LTKEPQTYGREKRSSLTNIEGKTRYPYVEDGNMTTELHSVLISTQCQLKTLTEGPNFETTTIDSRKYTGS
jgi:hypothetical protein